MTDKLTSSVAYILLAILAVATVAVLVSNHAQTGNVLQSLGGSLSCSIETALSPITGSSGCSQQTPFVSSTFTPL